MKKIELILFDLGGVIVDFTGVKDIIPLLHVAASELEISERWNSCSHTKAFHLGKISKEEFGEKFVKDWGINLSPKDFLIEFRSWSRCLFPGAKELLDLLRQKYRLAALSNSNELHWDRNINDLGINQLFEKAISSHHIGLCKPNPEIYIAALRKLHITLDSTVFFDDVIDNVIAASELGINAFQVNNVKSI
jgi:glucose-1-phosphatase